MNEQTGSVTMYDTVEEIKNLNRVEGFDPRKFMRTLVGEDGAAKQYLDVVYRKLWFRLKNPDGKIVKKILKLTEQTAIVEARVYLHKEDAEESYIASAFAQKYFERESQFGPKYVELAETAAVGRALADAGYGLQFADLEGEIDPNVVDAPLRLPMDNGIGQTGNSTEGMTAEDIAASAQNQQMPQQTTAQGQPNEIQATASVAYGMPPAFGGGIPEQEPPAAGQNTSAVQNTPAMQNVVTGQPAQNTSTLRADMPVEQIYARMTYQTATAVVIPIGYNHGKTLGQVAVEKPKDLQWYVNEYKGPDNILRAAAKYLLDKATNQAA